MPRIVRPDWSPKYRKHRKSGQAIVTIDGRDFYLGPYGTKTSHDNYDRLILEWRANGRRLVVESEPQAVTVNEVCAAYLRHARQHYVKHGRQTDGITRVKVVIKTLRRLYGKEAAEEFGPRKLKAYRQQFIDQKLSRIYINNLAAVVKQMFKWAASEEMIPAEVAVALQTVSGLQKGRGQAPESKGVRSVEVAVVEATLPYLSPVLADMVRLQLATGMRPGELCQVRPMDIDRSGPVWVFRPQSHKTEHHGCQRAIAIGPKGQDVLRPYLLRADDAHCFSPKEMERKRRAEMHAARATPMSCGNRPGTNKKRSRKRPMGEQYSAHSYCRAIARAVEKANKERREDDQLPRWKPNQLRHTALTLIRKQFGLEGAQVVGGHAKAQTTEIYAERNLQLAAQVMAAIG